MPPILSFAVLPVAVYLALASLPRGRPAMIGFGVAGILAVLGVVLLAVMDDGGTGLAIAILSVAAIALAALVQTLRRGLAPGRPAWLYPGIVIAALLAGSLPAIMNLVP